MNKDLEEYRKDELILFNEMDDLTFEETSKRLKDLWKLIPSNYSVNPVRLMNKFNKKFFYHPDRTKHFRKFKIEL